MPGLTGEPGEQLEMRAIDYRSTHDVPSEGVLLLYKANGWSAASAVMALVQEGVIDLDQAVEIDGSVSFSDRVAAQKITLRKLLRSHIGPRRYRRAGAAAAA